MASKIYKPSFPSHPVGLTPLILILFKTLNYAVMLSSIGIFNLYRLPVYFSISFYRLIPLYVSLSFSIQLRYFPSRLQWSESERLNVNHIVKNVNLMRVYVRKHGGQPQVSYPTNQQEVSVLSVAYLNPESCLFLRLCVQKFLNINSIQVK